MFTTPVIPAKKEVKEPLNPKTQKRSDGGASFEQRTLVLATPSKDLTQACLALGLQAKNLYNTTHFAVNNVLTSYEKVDGVDDAVATYRLKPEIHANQTTALARFNVAVDRLNIARKTKYDLAMIVYRDEVLKDEETPEPKLTLLPRFESIVSSPTRTALDITVLDNVLREWLGLDGKSVYSRLPAKAAQLVLHRYKSGWSGFFEALKRFKNGGSAMTGMPRPPDYLAKDSRYVVELPLTQMGEMLIGLGARTIPVDFAESISLTSEELNAWSSYRIGEAVERACVRRGFGASCQAQHLRIVPHKQGVKFEVVVRVVRSLPEHSLLAKLESELGDALLEAGSRRNEVLIKAIQLRSNLKTAAIDFGVSNTAAIGYNTGARAQVVSAGRLEAVLGDFDARLDAMVAALTGEELRSLQSQKATLQTSGEKLPRADEMKLRKGLKALYANPAYLLLRGQRERWLADYLHKLSHGLVQNCSKRNIDVLVLGQNKGWKDGMNLGKTQNRRFGNVPIARLIELISYKAQALGMVVVTTEESYTSQASFVNNETLKVYKEEKKKEKKDKSSSKSTAPPAPVQAPASTGTLPIPQAHRPMGKRLKDERHTFVNHHQTGRWAKVHADVNGAFNMLRKVFKDFAYHAGLTLKYTLMRLSPRLGLTAIANLGVQGSKNPFLLRRAGALLII